MRLSRRASTNIKPANSCYDRGISGGQVSTLIGTADEGHVIVDGPTMRCISDGSGGGSRTAAWCVSPVGGDVNCAIVRSGYALRWDRYWRDHWCKGAE